MKIAEECFGKKSWNSDGNSSTVFLVIFRFSGCTEWCLFIYNYRAPHVYWEHILLANFSKEFLAFETTVSFNWFTFASSDHKATTTTTIADSNLFTFNNYTRACEFLISKNCIDDDCEKMWIWKLKKFHMQIFALEWHKKRAPNVNAEKVKSTARYVT